MLFFKNIMSRVNKTHSILFSRELCQGFFFIEIMGIVLDNIFKAFPFFFHSSRFISETDQNNQPMLSLAFGGSSGSPSLRVSCRQLHKWKRLTVGFRI